ncbi:MAG: N-acetylmuramoyl-L-alanine amidase [Lachnospiraceae bacterium]|nr:N-acetylmuramoyl-L-alanine amidase [Lachnospiraceae bacterium]
MGTGSTDAANESEDVGNESEDAGNEFIVVIDPGHGGTDPGKVGVNQIEEKAINLAIAYRLKALLELNDVTVILTRETDDGLYDPAASNKKADDLKKRVSLIEESKAALTVSIHQNSYPDEACRGAQTFYYTGSEDGKVLAEILQKQLKSVLADGNHREAKGNDSYYMLKKSICPTVIVECGFLSNPQEADLLASEEYQEKVAFALHLGILEYRNNFLLY